MSTVPGCGADNERMDLSLSSFTIPTLYRLGERSLVLKGSRLRRGIYRVLESLSRNKAEAARRAFASASSQPAYLDAAELDKFITRYYRNVNTRCDKRFPAEKAEERAAEVIQNTRRGRFSGPDKFLDIACGDGLTADAIARLGVDVTAIDLADSRFVGSCTFHQMDAGSMKFDDNTFDVV